MPARFQGKRRERRPIPRHLLAGLVRGFTKAVETIEPYTATHMFATGRLAVLLARRLGFRPAAIEVVRLGAILHDVGKLAIPPSLLLRQGRLTAVEYALMREHARIGRDILAAADLGLPLASVVGQHHERLDGSGYPDGLSGHRIMAESLVVAVADVAHALQSRRAYRDGLDEATMVRILEGEAATRLPPAYVAAAIDILHGEAGT
jgi:putative nucleotidyltransferase with HDIG domain